MNLNIIGYQVIYIVRFLQRIHFIATFTNHGISIIHTAYPLLPYKRIFTFIFTFSLKYQKSGSSRRSSIFHPASIIYFLHDPLSIRQQSHSKQTLSSPISINLAGRPRKWEILQKKKQSFPYSNVHPLSRNKGRKKQDKEKGRERERKVGGEKRTYGSFVEFSSVSFLFDGREQEDRGTLSPSPLPSRAIIISPG